VTETARSLDCSLYLVGGWIRDCFLGTHSDDYDFLVEGDVESLVRETARRIEGSYFVMGHQAPFTHRVVKEEVTLDFVPQHREGLKSELQRRDFTVNAVAWSFAEEKLYDPFDGLNDLQKQRLHIVSPEVLTADPLRLLRAVRFCTVLEGFRLSKETEFEIRRAPGRIRVSAVERIREETDRIMASGRAAAGFDLMREVGLLPEIFPELNLLADLAQGPYHHLDALAHTLDVVRQVDDLPGLMQDFSYDFSLGPEEQLVLSYAALFHDLGKRASLTTDSEGIPHFYGHEISGAGIAAEVMRRHCFPKKRAERVRRLIRYHVRGLGLVKTGFTEKALRRIIRKVGSDLPLHVLLSLADRRSARGRDYAGMESRTRALGQSLLDLYAEDGREVLSPPVLVTGRDVMKLLEISSGPMVGEILGQLRHLQSDGEIRTREEAIRFLRAHRT
jgi:poly(A) polymerase